jgi:hypothetical protein
MSRAMLGAKRVADPLTEAYRALYAVVEQQAWSDFNWDPVSYYYDRMICNWLLQLIDNALSDAQLEAVKPLAVHVIVLSLFRDAFRHHAKSIRTWTAHDEWVEFLFHNVASKLNLPIDALKDDGRAYPIEVDDLANCSWAKAVAVPFGLPPEKLLVCHSAVITGITEECGR